MTRPAAVPASRALQALQPGSRLVASPYCATPETLLRELGVRALDVGGMTLSTGLLFGDHPYAEAVRGGRLDLRCWHVGGGARALARAGLVDYVPCRANDVASTFTGFDAVLLRIGPPDRSGRCSLGPSLSYTRAAVDAAALVIAEIDHSFPRVHGQDTSIALDEIDVLVEADTATCTYVQPTPTPASRVIAGHVLDALPKDATLQLGIGTVPESIAAALDPHDDRLGRVVGLANDAMIPLLEAGTACRDGTPLISAVELLGTQALLAAANENPALWMASSAVVHDPAWLAHHPRLVSVCSALQVDLTGQVASEAVDDALVAGIGGSVDFVDGAHLSPGGLRIVALPAVTTRGVSRVVRQLGPATPVTLPRHGVDAVVTEHGIAWLLGRSLAERAEAIAAIAAPEHRAALADGSADG